MKYAKIKSTVTLEKSNQYMSQSLESDYLKRMLNTFVKLELGENFNIIKVTGRELSDDNIKFHITIKAEYKNSYQRWVGKSQLKDGGFKDKDIAFI